MSNLKIQKGILKNLYSLFLKSSGVSIDTRSIQNENIYFALKGDNFNGNDYAKEALETKGASYVVVDELRQNLLVDERVIQVDNVLSTLQQLSTYHRDHLKASVIGLTGSNGKTTTKELLYSILEKNDPETYATQGNLNNHIGVPLTLLSIPLSAKYAIVEMGSNQPGDIAELCAIAQPNYGLITNIGKTHLEKLKSEKGVFEEKIHLYEWIKKQKGVFFQNVGDPFLAKIIDKSSIAYSKTKTYLSRIETHTTGPYLSFNLIKEDQNTGIKTNLFGEFNIENISAAITIAEYFSVPTEIIKEAIEEYIPSNMRSQIKHTDDNIIILDAYNANPVSLLKTVEEFSKMKATHKIAIIGDMLELGESSEKEHKEILETTKSLTDINFYFVGQKFKLIATENDNAFLNLDECISYFKYKNIQNSMVLLKGSRGIELEKLLPLF